MAVAVFGTVSSQASSSDPSNLSHTIASGASNVLLVGGTGWIQSTNTLTSVIWDPAGDNQTLTENIEAVNGSARGALNSYTGPANQDDTAYTLRFDYLGGMSAGAQGAINFSGVDQTTPVSNATSESGSSTAANVTVTTAADADDLVIDQVTSPAFGDLTVDGSQNQRWLSAGSYDFGSSTEAGGTNPTEMDWSISKSGAWLACGMLINAAAGGGGGLSIPVAMHHYQQLRNV
jgi:hypothetical protein